MNWERPLGSIALLVVAVGIVGALTAATGVFAEGGLLDSSLGLAALVTGGVIVLGLTVIAALGRPWRSARTPYW